MLQHLRLVPLASVGFALTLLCTSTAVAAPAPRASRFQRKVAPLVELWLSVPRLRSAKPRPITAAQRAKLRAPVLLRFRSAPDAALIKRLTSAGVLLRRSSSGEGWRHLGLFYPASTTRAGLRALARERAVARVDLDRLPYWAPRPLDLTAKESQASAAWRNAAQPAGLPLTGKGITIGNLDSGIDVYHPAFFRADGGLFAWIDVDGNGRFDVGKDAVDLDGDGKAGTGETLGLIEARVTDLRQQTPILDSVNGRYDTGRDWLYADANQNGKRDFGLAAGFDDKTPTFGERLFVAEDANGDGQLGTDEKLRALKTSKISNTYLGGVARARGVDLAKTPNGVEGLHGTGTSGIMVSGQRGHLSRVGLAPDADLVMAVANDNQRNPTDPYGGISDALIWLVKERKVNLVLHEYAPWSGLHLDGSSSHEQLLDQASGLGIPQVTPAGNLAMAGDKHARLQLAAGATGTLPFEIPTGDPRGQHSFAQLSFLWRDTAAALTFELTDPAGNKKTLTTDNTQGDWWDAGFTIAYYSWRSDSPRGTALFNIYLIGGDANGAKPVTAGTWTLTVKNPAGKAVELWGYTADALSSWGPGIGFRAHTQAEGTICWPATADTAITIGAYAAHVGKPYEDELVEKSGQLRGYSSRGKRIDGTSIMDIAAPDNPLTPVNRFVTGGPVQHGLGEYIVFGGTSGAGPHVAAGVALLLQKEPTLTAAQVKKRVRDSALVDADVGAVPSDNWGAGKLRIYRMLFGEDPVASKPPTVTIQGPAGVYEGDKVSLRAMVDDAEDGPDKLRVRWDVGYDDAWGAWGPAKTTTVQQQAPAVGQELWFKVQVEDSSGLRSSAVWRRIVQPASARPDGGPIGGDGSGGGGDDGGCAVASDSSPISLPLTLTLLFAALFFITRRRG
jgi:subtilisin family serine protease